MATQTESTIAISVLGFIIAVLSVILMMLCCMRHRRMRATQYQGGEILPLALHDDDSRLPISLSLLSEREQSRKMSEAPPLKGVRKAPINDVHLDTAYRVTYVTDVEGNWEYFCSFVRRSEGLRWGNREADDPVDRLELVDGWRFIFGGDAVDKGGPVGGSVRFSLCLVSLKQRYPERVTILLGNRDLNKMRLTSELHPSQLAPELLPDLPGPKWIPAGPKRVTPEQHLRKLVAGASGVEAADVDAAQLAAFNTPANRLRYVLKETMGADGDLDRRVAELKAMKAEGVDLSPLTSHPSVQLPSSGEGEEMDAAVASYAVSVAEGGWMRELIQLGELGVLSGDSLFVHGGLISRDYYDNDENTDAYGHVPGIEKRIDPPVEWLTELKRWKTSVYEEWVANPLWANLQVAGGVEGCTRGGEGLMDYCIRGQGPSVVLGRHLDADSMPRPAPYSLMKKCNRNGISRLVLGHTPHGNCPTVIKTRDADAALEVVMNDTSYSNMKTPDNRGQAVSEFVLYSSCDARVNGVLDDGAEYDYTLGVNSGPPEELVGRSELTMHAKRNKVGEPLVRFVKAKMTTGDYLLCHVNGFKYDYFYLSENDTVAAVGAVEVYDEIRASGSGIAGLNLGRNLGVSASLSSNLSSSREGGKRDWSCKLERASEVGLP